VWAGKSSAPGLPKQLPELAIIGKFRVVKEIIERIVWFRFFIIPDCI